MKIQSRKELLLEIERWRSRAEEAEETLRAIREGEVDALLISGEGGEKIYTLKSADLPYRVFLEAMNDGALTLTAEGNIYFCNKRFAAMVKSPIEKVVGTNLSHWICEDDKEIAREVFRLGRKDFGMGEISLCAGSQTKVPVHLSISPLHLDDIIVACAVVMDISDRSEAEAKIQSYLKKLEHSNQELENFAFIASHDLNEPLRKIRTFASLLAADSELGERQKDFISRIRDSANRMQELLTALLRYARIESKGEEFRPVHLDEVVQDAISDMEVRIRETGSRVMISPLPKVKGDSNQLRQLFQNLVENAIKYRSPDVAPVIRLSSEEDDGLCRILVEDNGIGFDEKYLETIFKPFQRLHSKSEYSGTGIGLAICRKVVERHGGTITARSAPGKGSTFIVTLPVNGDKQ